jgi:hypothetical protein
MRVGLIISVVIHAAIFLWVTLAPGAKPFDPARADPILVELLSPKEVPPLAEPEPKPDPPKSELSEFELPKPAPLKSASLKPEPAKPEPPKPEPPKPVLQADPKPPPKSDPKTTAAPSAEDQAATVARLTWMLNLPGASSISLGALPSESRSDLSSDEIAKFKARVSKCWVAPADVPSTPGFIVSIRVALKPDGALGAEPALVLAPASLSGPVLWESAKRALQQCQPYDFLPADKYQDWKILELSFSVYGPSDDLGPPALNSSSFRP